MAESPAHKFGQMIGDLLETAIEPLMREVAARHALYLDVKGARPARGGKRKITWIDLYGNGHDLDFVLEKGGTPQQIGTPVAFVETAWRRYTKHSRNKAQEIQGAIVPLALTHKSHAPFIGVILAGEYTTGSLTQLKSLGFQILHFSYEAVVKAFKTVRINADFDEDTPDAEVSRKVQAWQRLSAKKKKALAAALVGSNQEGVTQFRHALDSAITRQVQRVIVLPLYGRAHECGSVAQAIRFIEGHDEQNCEGPLARYEVQIRYTNGDRIEGQFNDKQAAIEFLRIYLPPLRPAAEEGPQHT
jgi:hypothetical protein